jgi:large subunit ribosomal protein L20
MPRVKRGFTRHRRHAKVLGMVKGHQTSRGHLFRTANQEMMKSLMYAYRDRRTRKRDMRALWIIRINAAARENGLPYNRFIAGMNTLGLELDRKMLAEMAVNDPHGFAVLAARIKGEPEPARKAAPAPAVAAPAAETAASTAVVAPAADTTVIAPATQGELQTEEEKDLEAAGVPEEESVAPNDQTEHSDPQQGESR